jgi:lipoprotein-anchoring transpeptidase ErfK/SrfK
MLMVRYSLVGLCCGILVTIVTPTAAIANTDRSSQSLGSRPSIATPIATPIVKRSPKRRWIEVDLSSQQLTAWEDKVAVYQSPISSGKMESPTLEGKFQIQSMHLSSPMRGAGYNVPDVPYTLYYSGHYAIHGAYWHDRFGTPVSRGCVNLPLAAADWLFGWANLDMEVVIHQ